MTLRTLSTAVLTAAAASIIGGLAGAAVGQAAPNTETPPPCVAEGTCAVLTPKSAARYVPLTPPTSPQQAPLMPSSAR